MLAHIWSNGMYVKYCVNDVTFCRRYLANPLMTCIIKSSVPVCLIIEKCSVAVFTSSL
jgi:hypothetical protein